MIGHVAVYIIIPEIIFGLSFCYCYELVSERKNWLKIPAAFIVMLLYMGSVSFFLFFV